MGSSDLVPGRLTVARMRCKQWGCSFCAEKNRLQWRAYLLDTLNKRFKDEKWCFITLTAHPKAHVTPALSLKNIKQVWDKIYDKMRYKYKRKLSYVITFETHKSGRYHLHALINLGMEYDEKDFEIDVGLSGKALIAREKRHPDCLWLKQASISSGGGPMVHLTRVRARDTGIEHAGLIVGYIIKYISKMAVITNWPPRARRIITTQDIGSPKKKGRSGFDWHVVKRLTVPDVLRGTVYSLDLNRAIELSDFDENGLYPPENEEG